MPPKRSNAPLTLRLRSGREGRPSQRASAAAAAGPALGEPAAEQGLALLRGELELHGLRGDVARPVADELQAILAKDRGGPREQNASVRRLLRHLRQLRSGGSRVKEEVQAAGCAAAAERIWAEHLASPSASSPAPALPAPPEGATQPVVPPMPQDAGKVCFVISGVLSHSECRALIEQCDASGWEAAALEYGLGSGELAGESVVNFGLRDSDRCMQHDERLSAQIWQRLRDHVPAEAFAPLQPVRVNSCFRCLRYSEGQAGFAKHQDGRCVVGGEISRLTVQLYLNEGFEGGATRLCVLDDMEDASRGIDVVPRTGMAFVFDQSILHKGCPVRRGTKYTARTEIMYSGGTSAAAS